MNLAQLDLLLNLRAPDVCMGRYGLSQDELAALSLTPTWADWLKANLSQVTRESRWQEMGLPEGWNHAGE